MITNANHLSNSWLKSDIFDGLNGADVEFVNQTNNDGEYENVAINWVMPSVDVWLDHNGAGIDVYLRCQSVLWVSMTCSLLTFCHSWGGIHANRRVVNFDYKYLITKRSLR